MIYLDNAATTLYKPPAVMRAVNRALTTMTSPGRGGYRASKQAERVLYECRVAAADLFGVEDPENVVFTFNATHALNIAIKSMVKPGDSVLVSGYEHNAVTRTLAGIDDIEVRTFGCNPFQKEKVLLDFKEKVADKIPKVVICTHVSNVYGYILPVDDIAMLCRNHGIPLIVDASQSAGCMPISVNSWGAAFVAMPGHKALMGPQGTGLLLCATQAKPLITGGTGSESRMQKMPDFLPDRLEAGTHNVPGIAGLLEGLRFVRTVGTDVIMKKERQLLCRTVQLLTRYDRVRLFHADHYSEEQSGVLSFQVEGKDCHRVAENLAGKAIAVRSGLHCAPLAHETVGTIDEGTVRVSFSFMTTMREIEIFCQEIGRLCKEK